MDIMQKLQQSADYINSRTSQKPQVAIILGSGLGAVESKITNKIEIKYEDIPHFPLSTVDGHAGKLIFGQMREKSVLAMSGRFHYYEGYSMQEVAYPIRVMKLLGIKKLIITNAAGGVNKSFDVGDIMIIKDHIKFFDDSPLRGTNLEEFGIRFPDMTYAYDAAMIETAKECLYGVELAAQEGVYAFMPGPTFETPAEINALRVMGADAVGMSTVPEVICAVHCGIRVLGMSCITNMAAGILDRPLSHIEVNETADRIRDRLVMLIKMIIDKV